MGNYWLNKSNEDLIDRLMGDLVARYSLERLTITNLVAIRAFYADLFAGHEPNSLFIRLAPLEPLATLEANGG